MGAFDWVIIGGVVIVGGYLVLNHVLDVGMPAFRDAVQRTATLPIHNLGVKSPKRRGYGSDFRLTVA